MWSPTGNWSKSPALLECRQMTTNIETTGRSKRRTASAIIPPRKQRTARSSGNTCSPLLSLPAELRNTIYSLLAEANTAYLKNGTISDHSSMMQVCHQVREEYVPILLLYANTISTHVKDCDFRHVVTFLNRLSEAQLNALPSVWQRLHERSFKITLTFTTLPRLYYPDGYLLHRWLNRVADTTKKGAKLGFDYYIPLPPGYRQNMYDKGSNYALMCTLCQWQHVATNYREAVTDPLLKQAALRVIWAFNRW